MIAATFDRITIRYAAAPVFTDLSWDVHDDRIVGLVGPNGCGKSTMLKAIAGHVEASDGTIALRSDLTVGYLPQTLAFGGHPTVFEAVRRGAARLLEIERELLDIETQLADADVYEDPVRLDDRAALLDARRTREDEEEKDN